MRYKCETNSVIGFVQQLACNYLPSGYWHYTTGSIPSNKDPSVIDERIVSRYGIDLTRSARARRKAKGLANLHYLRYERFFVILATHGIHEFHKAEAEYIKNVTRKQPIHFEGYSLCVQQGGFVAKDEHEALPVPDGKYRVRVQIGKRRYLELLAYFKDIALRRSAEELGKELYNLPFEPYAPIRRQLLRILLTVNKIRKAAGLDALKYDVIRYRRDIVTPLNYLEVSTFGKSPELLMAS